MFEMSGRSRKVLLGSILIVLLAVAVASAAVAQSSFRVGGTIFDPSGEPVAGAKLVAQNREPVLTDENGRFSIELERGECTLRVSHPAYPTLRLKLTVELETDDLELRFESSPSLSESVTVIGIRAGEELPVTTYDLDREEIEALSYGQDVPTLLQNTPSINWYSDSGVGSNYSYFSLRGITQTRINVTFDGAPLNDPAEHALYFNNFHDFTSAVDSIQVQRGVGTSSVGSPAYGGSVNFASIQAAEEPGGDLQLVLGSFDTRRASLAYESGILDNGFSVSGRFSYADTDGYRDNSGSEHRTFFLNAGWQGEKSSLKFTSFFGDERSQMSYLAVDPDTLRQNRRFNPLDVEERDKFGQDFAQLRYTRVVGPDTLLSASLYYNGAAGWFLVWDDPVARNDLLQFGIDQAFVGSMFTAVHTAGRLATTVGLHFNDFSGDHTLDVAGSRAYINTGDKQTANAFAKFEYGLDRWLLYGDLQLRWARFAYEGDVDLGSIDWTFLDPKLGVRRQLSERTSLYASLGRAQREPARLDLLNGEDNATVAHDLAAVRPEEVLDLEVGIDVNTPTLALQANVYAMEFDNEIALTGELSPIGLPLRENVEDSYRRGLELDLRWRATPAWSILHNSTFSRNKIESWTQFYDVYDAQGAWIDSVPITHTDVDPLLTPEVVLNLGAEWSRRDYAVTLMGRYVSDSQLDNTGNDAFRLPSYTNVDLRASLPLGGRGSKLRPTIAIFVNNLFDSDEQYPSGYSYRFINRDAGGSDSLDGIPFYYPLATRSVIVSMRLGF